MMGPDALTGRTPALAAGLGLHAMVAFAWSAIFVGAVWAWPALRRTIRTPGSALGVAVAYGPVIWLVMSLVVIPLATGRPPLFNLRWWIQDGAHIPFVSLPLVFTARRMLTRG